MDSDACPSLCARVSVNLRVRVLWMLLLAPALLHFPGPPPPRRAKGAKKQRGESLRNGQKGQEANKRTDPDDVRATCHVLLSLMGCCSCFGHSQGYKRPRKKKRVESESREGSGQRSCRGGERVRCLCVPVGARRAEHACPEHGVQKSAGKLKGDGHAHFVAHTQASAKALLRATREVREVKKKAARWLVHDGGQKEARKKTSGCTPDPCLPFRLHAPPSFEVLECCGGVAVAAEHRCARIRQRIGWLV